MMIKSMRKWNHQGFTIIESIIALVLVSIMAAMLYAFSQPLYTSLGALTWFNDELLLQQSNERIIGDYKNQRNDRNNPYNPGIFRQDMITKYTAQNVVVVVARTGFLTFTCAGTPPNSICTAAWPPQATIPGGTLPPVLIITVQQNERIIAMIGV